MSAGKWKRYYFVRPGQRWAEFRCHDNDVNVGVE